MTYSCVCGYRIPSAADQTRRGMQHLVATRRSSFTRQGIVRKMAPTSQQPAGDFNPARLAVYSDRFADRGLVSRKVDVHQAVGQRFVDDVNAVSGAYRPA